MAEIKSFTAYHRLKPVKEYFDGPLFLKTFMDKTRHSLERLFNAACLRIYGYDAVNGYFATFWRSNGSFRRVACDENCARLRNDGDLLRFPLKNDLRLVGMRPLSRQYLELYTPEHREFRTRVKPGLLPPFYADLPVTLEEIMDSERRYIEAYLQKPVRTQARYFFKCFYNIVIKGKRSA